MLHLSELMIQNPQLNSFDELLAVIKQRKHESIHLKIDIKPNYPDTPADWEDKVEGAFSGVHSVMGPKIYKTEDDF
ncbi:MAG TPA: sulfur relay protein DsrC [Gammaproteobacteria bacterium]